MTNKELNKVLEGIKYVPNENERDEITQIILKAANDSITLKKLKKMTATVGKGESSDLEQIGRRGFIKFSKKEINKMPERYQKVFILDDKMVSFRFHNGSYHARYRRKGYNIEVCAKSFELMKNKFIDRLNKIERERALNQFPTFGEFLNEWLAVKKRTVKETTYKSYVGLCEYNLLPRFGEKTLNEITRKDVQDFVFELTDAGKNRTAHKTVQLMTAMFNVAMEDYPNLRSPMTKIVLTHYEAKKGSALSKAEEKELIDYCKANPSYQGNSAILVLLYTGMRVGELASMRKEGDYIYCESEKIRLGRKQVIRKIPISPMLKKVLPMIDFDVAKTTKKSTVRDALKRVFPERHVHEFRYTFITRAKECGVNPEVVMLWAGHESDSDVKTSKVDRGYTTYSEEYLLGEVHKIEYDL